VVVIDFICFLFRWCVLLFGLGAACAVFVVLGGLYLCWVLLLVIGCVDVGVVVFGGWW